LTTLEHISHHDPGRSKNIAFLTVEVVEQGNPRIAVRVVLDRCDLRWYSIFVSLEVDHAIATLVTTTPVTSGLAAIAIAAARAWLRLHQRPLGLGTRQLSKVRDRLETPAGAGWLTLS
jgi:hypothetical protein